MDDSAIKKVVPTVVASPLRKLSSYLRQNPVSSAIFIIGVLYSTVFIEYVANDAYFDVFKSQGVRAACVIAVAGASYADPRNAVVYLVALLRTFSYVRKPENFSMKDIKKLAEPKWIKDAKRRSGDSDSDSDEDPVLIEGDAIDD